jgi:hypothetical protein
VRLLPTSLAAARAPLAAERAVVPGAHRVGEAAWASAIDARSRQRHDRERHETRGKAAIVNGAGSGFGEGIKRCAVEGARVVVNDIAVAGGGALCVKSSLLEGRRALRADVAKDADVARLVASSLDAFGDLDVVVNNAGTTTATSRSSKSPRRSSTASTTST